MYELLLFCSIVSGADNLTRHSDFHVFLFSLIIYDGAVVALMDIALDL